MTFRTETGITEVPSHHSVDETVGKLKGILAARGLRCLRWWTTAEKRRRRD
jgi:hypothetical protein